MKTDKLQKELRVVKDMVRDTVELQSKIKHWLVKYGNIPASRLNEYEILESLSVVKKTLEEEIHTLDWEIRNK